MQPTDVQAIGDQLAIKWADGAETYIPLEKLRRHCPCAGCKGERDITGKLYKGPDIPLTPRSFEVRSLTRIGSYALQPVWADGHATGIYSFDYLHEVADAP